MAIGRDRMTPVDGQLGKAVERALRELGWKGNVCCADTFVRRLLGMTVLAPFETTGMPRILVFPQCNSVHTFNMGYPLDIAFADEEGGVLACYRQVQPGHMLMHAEACMVLERASIDEDWALCARAA